MKNPARSAAVQGSRHWIVAILSGDFFSLQRSFIAWVSMFCFALPRRASIFIQSTAGRAGKSKFK
ncbi:MAG: hypothetical protein CFE29_30155 [Bradyrhizobiaceae bacterium PARB1]|nr:MAG: hypothetical protein BGP05_07725 [Rhizobiales bacterium 62-47]OYU86256.1 MAG: hypothetical protein CFE29_30155 [Bradyrhizobiaceae bacterium PARB1]